jgi:hypothetical protein
LTTTKEPKNKNQNQRSLYYDADQLVTADIATKLNARREKEGRLIDIPTVREVYARHQAKKGWYALRNELMTRYMRMASLETPFARNKAGAERAASVDKDAEISFAVDSTPFSIMTQSISMLDDFHPFARAAGRYGQTDNQIAEYQKFIQAMLDMRMYETGFIGKMTEMFMMTGWLPLYFPYDPILEAQGEFPYRIEIANPLGTFPELDDQKRPLWVTRERRMTGAQLVQTWGRMPGVAELIENEPDDDDLPTGAEKGRWQRDNLLSSPFTVISYEDDEVRCLLVNGSEVSEVAARHNPALSDLRSRSKKEGSAGGGGPPSVYVGSKYHDDPYRGICRHGLGTLPMAFVFCWPEARDLTVGYSSAGLESRFEGLPFFYAIWEEWKQSSTILAQMHTMMNRYADPKLLVKTKRTNFSTSGKVITLNPDEDARYLELPPIPQEMGPLIEIITEHMEKATYAGSTFGKRAGTSGRQQDMAMEAGNVKLEHIKQELQRAIGHACRGITRTMIYRGPEDLEATGTAYTGGGRAYPMRYNAKALKVPPMLEVELKKKKAYTDPERIAIAGTAKEFMSMHTILQDILEIPDPAAELARMRDEAAEKEKQAFEPYAEKMALETEIELGKELEDLRWKKTEQEAEFQVTRDMREVEEAYKLLPAEAATKEHERVLWQIADHFQVTEELAALGINPPAPTQQPQEAGTNGPPSPPMPPNSGPIAGGPSSPLMSPGLPMIPPPGLPGRPLGARPWWHRRGRLTSSRGRFTAALDDATSSGFVVQWLATGDGPVAPSPHATGGGRSFRWSTHRTGRRFRPGSWDG